MPPRPPKAKNPRYKLGASVKDPTNLAGTVSDLEPLSEFEDDDDDDDYPGDGGPPTPPGAEHGDPNAADDFDDFPGDEDAGAFEEGDEGDELPPPVQRRSVPYFAAAAAAVPADDDPTDNVFEPDDTALFGTAGALAADSGPMSLDAPHSSTGHRLQVVLSGLSDDTRPLSSLGATAVRQQQEGTERADGSQIGAAGMMNIDYLTRLARADAAVHAQLGMTPFHVTAALGDHLAFAELLGRFAPGADPMAYLAAADVAGRTPLHFAVYGGAAKCVDALLRFRVDVHAADADGRTVGHWAAFHGRHKLVPSLLNAGYQISMADKEGRSTLHWAAACDRPDALAVLLKSPAAAAALNTADGEGLAPLHWAAIHNRPKNLQALLKAGAVAAAQDSAGRTALHWIISYKDTACAKLLCLPAVVNVTDAAGKGALHMAAAEGSSKLCELIAKTPTCNVNLLDKEGRAAMHWACALDHDDVVALLLKNKAPDTVADRIKATPLHYCAQYNQPKCATVLLKHKGRADLPDEHGRTALMWAVSQQHAEVTRALLAGGVDPNAQDQDGRTALHLAAYVGFAPGVEAILKTKGALVDVPDASAQTPVFAACDQGQAAVVQQLVAAKCRLNLPDAEGKLPLHWLAIAGRAPLFAALLVAGSDMQAVDQRGETPLHYACFFGHTAIVTQLMQQHAELNVQDLEGISPLHWAVLRGHEAVAAQLLQAGAYPNYMENNGNKSTPLDYAVAAVEDEALSQRLATLLTQHGAVNYETMCYLAAIVVQSHFRGSKARRETKELVKRHAAAKVITSAFRGRISRAKYLETRAAIVRIQSTWRGYRQRKSYLVLRDAARASKAAALAAMTGAEAAAANERAAAEREALAAARATAAKAQAQRDEADTQHRDATKAVEEKRREEEAKKRGDEARRRLAEEKKAKEAAAVALLEKKRQALAAGRLPQTPGGVAVADELRQDMTPEEAEEQAVALLLAKERVQERRALVHTERQRKKGVQVKVRAAILIQRAWRAHRFRLRHPTLASPRRPPPVSLRGNPKRLKGGHATHALAHPPRSNKPHHVAALPPGLRRGSNNTAPLPPFSTFAPGGAPPAGRVSPSRRSGGSVLPAIHKSFEREQRRPDYMARTLAALTIQLWWRRYLANAGRQRRARTQAQTGAAHAPHALRLHEAPAYLVHLQQTRVRTIYGPGAGGVVHLYRPPVLPRRPPGVYQPQQQMQQGMTTGRGAGGGSSGQQQQQQQALERVRVMMGHPRSAPVLGRAPPGMQPLPLPRAMQAVGH